MIKLCNILSYNKSTKTVVATYGNAQIQFIANTNHILGTTAYIDKADDGTYQIVSEADYKKALKTEKKQRVFADKREKYNEDKLVD